VIAIVDYGIGNLGSVTKAFRRFGAECALVSDPRALLAADALVLPGDGAFGATMQEIRSRGQAEPLLQAARGGTPLLGICIGMQVLFEESEEHGRHAGLALLPGRVRRSRPSCRSRTWAGTRSAARSRIRCWSGSRTDRTCTSCTPTSATRRPR
jgi:imidazole glycerol phosphate synthase glutamine amidotransferase subunit